MNIAFLIILAVIPSIIWLLFYLRKDKHPEPNRIIIKMFFWGIVSALMALFFEWLYERGLAIFSLENTIILVIGGFAFIEEYLKYFVVKQKALNDPAFDEPIDAMIYLIIAALGFAAAENILLLNNLSMAGKSFQTILEITLGRFLGAVFLHALASGIVGYFLARSLILKSASSKNYSKRKVFMGLGILLATAVHGIYNYIVLHIIPSNENGVLWMAALLVIMAIVISSGFKKLRKLKSICKI